MAVPSRPSECFRQDERFSTPSALACPDDGTRARLVADVMAGLLEQFDRRIVYVPIDNPTL